MKKTEPNKENITFTDEYLDLVSDNASKIKISDHNKSTKVFEEINIISDGADRQEHVFFTPQEEESLSGKLGAIGEIVNITEQDFLSL